MSEVNGQLCCTNCHLRVSLLAHCFPCSIHGLCTGCLNWLKSYEDLTICPYCNPSEASSSHNISGLINCSACKINLEEANTQSCRECNKNFCFNCSIKHKKASDSSMHTFYPISPVVKLHCVIHNQEVKYFCKSCSEILCSECWTSHDGHDKCEIEKQIRYLRNSVLEMTKYNDDKLNQINDFLSMLNMRENLAGSSVEKLESQLIARRDDILQSVKEEFDNQINSLNEKRSEFSSEIRDEVNKLEKLQADLQYLKELSVHYLGEALNYNVLRDFYSFETVCDIDVPTESNSMQFITLKLIGSDCVYYNVTDTVKGLLGVVNTGIDEDALLPNEENQEYDVKSSIVHEAESYSIKDICYELEQRHLYLIEVKSKGYYILRFSEGEGIQEHCLNVSVEDSPYLHISLLPQNKLLLQTSTSLKSTDLKHVEDYYVPFLSGSSVMTMSVSPCQTCTYYLCREGFVYKCNQMNKFSAIVPISFANECQWMSVNQNLDWIAFTGKFHKINLFSFNQAKILHALSNSDTSIYRCAVFLSENLMIAYEVSNSCLEIINIDKKEMIRRITNFEGDNLINFGKVCSLTAGSPGILYVQTEKSERSYVHKVQY